MIFGLWITLLPMNDSPGLPLQKKTEINIVQENACHAPRFKNIQAQRKDNIDQRCTIRSTRSCNALRLRFACSCVRKHALNNQKKVYFSSTKNNKRGVESRFIIMNSEIRRDVRNDATKDVSPVVPPFSEPRADVRETVHMQPRPRDVPVR